MSVTVHLPRATATVRYTAHGLSRARSFTVLAPADATDRDLYRLARKAILDDYPMAQIHKTTLQRNGEQI